MEIHETLSRCSKSEASLWLLPLNVNLRSCFNSLHRSSNRCCSLKRRQILRERIQNSLATVYQHHIVSNGKFLRVCISVSVTPLCMTRSRISNTFTSSGRPLQHTEMSRSHNLFSWLEKLAGKLFRPYLERRQMPRVQVTEPVTKRYPWAPGW